MKAAELRERRAELVKKARAILDRAEAEQRDTNTEEASEYDKIMAEIDARKEQIDRLEKLEEAEDEMEAPAERSGRRATAEERARARADPGHEAEVRTAFGHWARTGQVRPALRTDQARLGEYRDLVLGALGADTAGGYLVTPVQISEAIVRQIDNVTFIRRLCHVERVTEAKSLGVRQQTANPADADWTTEVAQVATDTAQAFGRRDLTPAALTKLVLVSIRLLMASADVEALVRDRLAYKFGITEEKAFLTGTGSGQPLGVFTASAGGVPTTQDVTTAGAGALAGDDLIEAKYFLRQPYLQGPKAAWVMHRSIVKVVRKLKDNYGQYLWQPGLAGGAPDTIVDVPVKLSEYAPATLAGGNYVAVIGNFEYYWVAEVTDIVLQRLVERYSDTNEVGFKGIAFVDGAPILGEAFARIKIQ